VDWVLWGNGNCSVPTAPVLSETTAIFRLNGGCTDSDNSAADFVADFPLARNSSVSHACASGPDCNGNGVEDSVELASGALTDVNGNGTPDACEGAAGIEAPVSATVLSTAVAATMSSWRAQGATVEDENGRTNVSYTAARWSNAAFKSAFDARFGAGRWVVRAVSLVVREDEGASAGGPIQLYYTNNDAISLAPGNTSTRFGNFATDFADRQLATGLGYSGGGPGLDFVMGVYRVGESNTAGGTAVANELRAGSGSLTLLLWPTTDTVLANFAGSSNGTWAGPTLVVFAQEGCGTADFNCDGDTGTDADIAGFFACLSGSCPSAPCRNSADFNADGDVGTDADIEAFFRVLAGGNC
jgi:hypothetical protein